MGKPSLWWTQLQMGRGRKPWHGEHLLPLWSSQDGGLWCTHHLTLMQLTRAKCSYSEEVHQHPLYPSRVLPSPLSRCEHSLGGCFLCPIPTGLAISLQITLLLWHQGGPASGWGRGGVESVFLLLRGSVTKLRRGVLPLWLNFTVGPFISIPSPSRIGHPDGGMIRLSPSPQAFTRCQSGQSSAGMWVGPSNTGVGSKIWWLEDRINLVAWEIASTDGLGGRCYLSRSLFAGELNWLDQVVALVHLLCSPPLLHEMSDTLATGVQQDEDVPATSTVPEPEGSQALGPPNSPAHHTGTLPFPVPHLLDIPFVGTPLVGHPFIGFIASPTQKKQDQSSSGSLGNHHNKRICVDSQEIEARSEHSSAQGNEDTP